MKERKLGRCEFKLKGYKVMPVFKSEKPSGKYAIVAGRSLVSDQMSLKDAIEKLKSEDFKPSEKIRKF